MTFKTINTPCYFLRLYKQTKSIARTFLRKTKSLIKNLSSLDELIPFTIYYEYTLCVK